MASRRKRVVVDPHMVVCNHFCDDVKGARRGPGNKSPRGTYRYCTVCKIYFPSSLISRAQLCQCCGRKLRRYPYHRPKQGSTQDAIAKLNRTHQVHNYGNNNLVERCERCKRTLPEHPLPPSPFFISPIRARPMYGADCPFVWVR